MRTFVTLAAAASASMLLPGVARADEPEDAPRQDDSSWRISTGLNYSEGDYGDTRKTKVVTAPLAIKYRNGAFSARLSASWVHIKGPGSLIDTPQGRDAGYTGGGGGSSGEDGSSDNYGGPSDDCSNSGSGGGDEVETESALTAAAGLDDQCSSGGGTGGGVVPLSPFDENRSGIGDVALTLAYEFDLGRSTWFEVSTRIKLPTASKRKRIGTGKVDFTVGGELSHEIGDVTLYAGGRYRFLDSPAGRTLRDTYGFTGGASYRIGKTYVGADYDWQRSATPGRGPSSEATAWVNFALGQKVRMQFYGSTGFTRNSADFAGGVSVSFRLD